MSLKHRESFILPTDTVVIDMRQLAAYTQNLASFHEQVIAGSIILFRGGGLCEVV
jgi:hypothetical protein